MTLREAMTSNPVTLPSTASVTEAARAMRDGNIGDVVVKEGKEVCGIVTDRDIVVRALAEGKTDIQLGQICSRELAFASAGDDVSSVIDMMRKRSLRRVLVMDKGNLEGIVSIGDLAVKSKEKSVLAAISGARPNR